ncbi:FAD/NAD(P)-binding protein [Streptomyces sp. NPDC051020]|uniref:FAD/NAD(P)-binding protein n=1 Tax=Streptomyces sp. NPDC051020 TaxID=3155409 RepID=UPI0034336E85
MDNSTDHRTRTAPSPPREPIAAPADGPVPQPFRGAGDAPSALAVLGRPGDALPVLARLVRRFRNGPAPMTVHLVTGEGTDVSAERDEDDLLGTTCAAINAFHDARSAAHGPSLYEWCVERGIGPVRPDDFLPLRLHRAYLRWAAGRIAASGGAVVRVVVHPEPATAVRPTADGGGETVVLADGTLLRVDAVLPTAFRHLFQPPVAPGPAPEPEPRTQPLHLAYRSVGAGERVAVLGLGLTALSVLTELTIGRGGRFAFDGSTAHYLPSGREPAVVLTVRAGGLPRTRPVAPPGRTVPAPLVFTSARLAQHRRKRAGGRLSLADDVLPALEAELDLAYYRSLLSSGGVGPETVQREFAARIAADGHRRLLDELRTAHGASPVHSVLSRSDEMPVWADERAYADWFGAELAGDLRAARAGLGADPVKDALEVLHDHRMLLRGLLEGPGLDEESTARFHGTFVPAVNRLVVGPDPGRTVELLALLASGVVRLGPGPQPLLREDCDAKVWRLDSRQLAIPASVTVDRIVLPRIAETPAGTVGDPLLSLPPRTGPGWSRQPLAATGPVRADR